MSSRTFAVIVDPQQWQRTPEELARMLEPFTGVSAPVLVSLLLRGPVTVEADLSQLGAQNLLKRLDGLGIPARLQTNGRTVVSHHTPAPDIAAALENMGVVDIEVADIDVDAHFPARPPTAPTVPRWDADDSEPEVEESRTVSGKPLGIQAPHEPTIQLGESPTPRLAHPDATTAKILPPDDVKTAPIGPASSGGWGTLFPDLDQVPTEKLPEPAPAAEVPQLRRPEPVEEARPSTPAPTPELEGAMTMLSTPAPNPAPERSSRADKPVAAAKPLVEAFKPKDDRPPYAPTGYDDRDPHLPKLAALLSAIAPGAGQIYNGDDDDALDYTLKAWRVSPWIASVNHARRRAERVRDFYLPWPQPGALFRAVRYALGFWFVVVSSVGIVTFVVRTAMERRVPEETGPTAADWDNAIHDARAKTVEARIAALDAMAEAAQEAREVASELTDEERAARIFTVGYTYCTQKDFVRCEALMKRAYLLNRADGRALRLQAWASLQVSAPDNSSMPDVGEVETLSEFELEAFQKEQETP